MKIHLSISLFFLALVTSFLFISTLGNFSPAIEDSDSIVVRKWMNITVDVRKRRILSMGSGKLYKTRLVGMLGPSGSGKSTFLNVLAERLQGGRRAVYNLKSDLQIIGNPASVTDVAFIHQEDQFFRMLTVEETLKLAAALRLQSAPRHTSNISSLVDDVMQALSLKHVAKSFVGDPTKRGISGGERKRLAVASELLGNPSLLLADEPTSGLDSFQAYGIMSYLSNLAKQKQMSVVCAIHQPRSSIWELLDDILLLACGRVIYMGPREEVIPYFAKLGYKCPVNTNPAEFLIDLVSFNSSNSESLSESRSRITRLADTFLMYQNTTEYEKSQERIRSLVEMNFSSTSIVSVHDTHNKPSFDTSNNNNNNCKHLFNHKRNGSNLQSSSNNQLKKKHLFAATLFQPLKSIIQATVKSGQRFSLLLSRAYKQMARDMETNVVRLLVSGVLAVIVGSVYGKATGIRDLTMSSGPTRINILAQAVVNVGMMSVVKTLQILKREKVIVDRERQSGQYSAGEYLFAKSMIELPVDAIFASVFGLVLHRFTDLHLPVTELAGLLSLFSLTCSSFGLAVGSVFPQADVALAVGPAITVVYIILGVFGPAGINSKDLPSVLKPFRVLSPMRWACEALCAAEFEGQPFQSESSSVNLLRDGASSDSGLIGISRRLLGTVKRVGQIVRGSGTVIMHVLKNKDRSSHKQMTDGDYVLENLGMTGDGSLALRAMTMMGRLIGAHFLVALCGLIFQPKTG